MTTNTSTVSQGTAFAYRGALPKRSTSGRRQSAEEELAGALIAHGEELAY